MSWLGGCFTALEQIVYKPDRIGKGKVRSAPSIPSGQATSSNENQVAELFTPDPEHGLQAVLSRLGYCPPGTPKTNRCALPFPM